MTESTRNYPPSIFPEKMQILSGSALKVLAMVIMFIDHAAFILLRQWPGAFEPYFYIGSKPFGMYRIARDIGRAAFPIFCFLLIEGFQHTSNRFRYGRNLLIFAFLSEIPFNYMYTNTWRDPDHQNVFFTLFFGFVALCAWEYFSQKPVLQIACLAAILAVVIYVDADYDWKGYGLILILYFLRHYKWPQAIVASCWLYFEWKACFAFISINMYNGTRGFIQGKWAKYFFYAFYPLHLILLVVLRQIIFLS